MRTKRALLNTVADLSYELVAAIVGFILPKMILSKFGSTYNGITASIAQFVSCIALLKSGIGGATRASLYKPLADRDHGQISVIVSATDRFMKKIALMFLAFLFTFACIYPIFVSDEFDWLFSFSLVLIIGISTVIQYYYGMTYQMLLQADQRQYVYAMAQIVVTVLNTIVAAVLIKCDFSIHIVKLGSTMVYLLIPIILNAYVSKHYVINKRVRTNEDVLRQRWDAFALQLANFINNNTDIVILTIFANVRTVSIYTVYHLVLNGLQKVVVKLAGGVEAALGNIIAKNEYDKLQISFSTLEYVILTISTIVYTCVVILIVPFVKLYTYGINDANYIVPDFAVVASLASFFYCVRAPYQYTVQAAGCFKETRNGSFVEAGINIVLSIVLVQKIGIAGVAVGTLIAMVFRTIQYAYYCYKHIVHLPFKKCIQKYTGAIVSGIFTILICLMLEINGISSVYQWCISGVFVFLIITGFSGLITILCYKNEVIFVISSIKKLRTR